MITITKLKPDYAPEYIQDAYNRGEEVYNAFNGYAGTFLYHFFQDAGPLFDDPALSFVRVSRPNVRWSQGNRLLEVTLDDFCVQDRSDDKAMLRTAARIALGNGQFDTPVVFK